MLLRYFSGFDCLLYGESLEFNSLKFQQCKFIILFNMPFQELINVVPTICPLGHHFLIITALL